MESEEGHVIATFKVKTCSIALKKTFTTTKLIFRRFYMKALPVFTITAYSVDTCYEKMSYVCHPIHPVFNLFSFLKAFFRVQSFN